MIPILEQKNKGYTGQRISLFSHFFVYNKGGWEKVS